MCRNNTNSVREITTARLKAAIETNLAHIDATRIRYKFRVKHVHAWSPRKGCLHADNRRIRYEIIVKIGNRIYNVHSCSLCHVDIDRRTTRESPCFFFVSLQLRRRVFTQHLQRVVFCASSSSDLIDFSVSECTKSLLRTCVIYYYSVYHHFVLIKHEKWCTFFILF